MINRRQFLQQMLCAAGVAAAPKFIFDVGKNLYKMSPLDLEDPFLGMTPEEFMAPLSDHINDAIPYLTGEPSPLLKALKKKAALRGFSGGRIITEPITYNEPLFYGRFTTS